MGKAILQGLIESGEPSKRRFDRFIVSVASSKSAQDLEAEFAKYGDHIEILHGENTTAARNADVVLLAFPPSQLQKALGDSTMPKAVEGKLVISIVAGASEQNIKDALSAQAASHQVSVHIVRAMPSIGAHVKESTALIAEPQPPLPANLQKSVETIFRSIGDIRTIPSPLFDEMTALSATCLALISVSVDGITYGGVSSGIPRHIVEGYFGQCIRGYASLLARGESPAELKNSLLIPQGITVQAILSLNRQGLGSAISDTLCSSVAYTKSMSKM